MYSLSNIHNPNWNITKWMVIAVIKCLKKNHFPLIGKGRIIVPLFLKRDFVFCIHILFSSLLVAIFTKKNEAFLAYFPPTYHLWGPIKARLENNEAAVISSKFRHLS